MAYARALLKISGEALMGNQGYGIDPEIVSAIAQMLPKLLPLARSWRLSSAAETFSEV